MLILAFVGIITRYFYFKFIFIRFCKVPKTIDEALNETVLSYFPWVLGFHFFMTIYMYSVPTIFAFETSIFSEWVIILFNFSLKVPALQFCNLFLNFSVWLLLPIITQQQLSLWWYLFSLNKSFMIFWLQYVKVRVINFNKSKNKIHQMI